MTMDTQTASPEARKAALARAVHHEVAKGGRVESQTDYDAVIRYGKSTNHTFHLLMSLLTLTIWAWTVWPTVALINVIRRKAISLQVDEYGRIARRKL